MCLGIPGKVVKISDIEEQLGLVDIGGITREVNLACVVEDAIEDLLDRWVLIHVGFALSVIDEQQAQATLAALQEIQQLDESYGHTDEQM